MDAPDNYEAFRPLRAILELRFPKAHQYWDDCGKLIGALEQRIPGLECKGLLAKGGFGFDGAISTGVTHARFYWDRVFVQQDPFSSDRKFLEAAEVFWDLSAKGLGVAHVNRVGHRLLYLLRGSSQKDAAAWLNAQRIWSARKELGEAFNEGAVLRTRLSDRQLRYGLGTGTVERAGQPKQVGVVLDFDFVSETKQSLGELNLNGFMRWNTKWVKENIHKVVRGSGE